MYRKIAAWWIMLRNVGDTLRMGRQIDQLFRYYIIETLNEEGLFDYLEEPRTYGQILAQFGYVDSPYMRTLLDVLETDRHNLIIQTDESVYARNTDEPMPDIGDIVGNMEKRYHNFGLMAKGMTRYIPSRLRGDPIELSDTFEQDGRQLMVKFDATLGSRVYAASREAAFAFLTRKERRFLAGKKLLEVGCGSGRETAEIWLKMGGNIEIVAVDPVPSMLELARHRFESYLDEMDQSHPPVTNGNRPVFEQVSATNLPYEDNSFDVVFHAFVLHWTSDPRKAISEIVRVLKPGGLVFGLQPTRPAANPYFDLVVRINQNIHGFFWVEEFRRWYAELGVDVETMTPITIFRGHKPEQL